MILTDMPEDLQMISPFFSDFLQNSPKFSDFLSISRFFFVSLHPKIRCPEKGLRCYNLYKSIKKRCSPAV